VIGLYDTIAAFDHERREAWIIAHEFSNLVNQASAETRATQLAQALGTDPRPTQVSSAGTWRAETTPGEHQARVATTIEAIRRGDIYQANITQRFLAEIPQSVDSYDLYLRLRAATAAPFAAFINAGEDLQILSASPERFLQVDTTGNVETRPIKGTRPRGATPGEDRALAAELLASAKDRAENLMIVDLLRNDLARVCAPGSVSVPVLCGLESFPAVHHLVSVVTGHLRPGATAMDLLRAAFPGGSVTGAPKIKAMEIIHDLEPAARGPYCGAIAWLGFDGAMDSSIVIRTLIRRETTLVAQAGGGIVAESDPAREYEESVTKVKPLLSVLGPSS
jgi:para-aminobenzoate synthetase component 1